MNLEQEIINLWSQGYSYSQIAEALSTNKAKVCRTVKPIKDRNRETPAEIVSSAMTHPVMGVKHLHETLASAVTIFRNWDDDVPVSLQEHLHLQMQVKKLLKRMQHPDVKDSLRCEIRVLRLVDKQLKININSMQAEDTDYICFMHYDDFVELLDLTLLPESRNPKVFIDLLELNEDRLHEYLQEIG